MEINLPFLNKVSLRDKAFLARELATMIESGIALDKSLSVLAETTKSQRIKEILGNVLADIQSGMKFSESLAKYPEVFDNIFIASVQAGENAGKLDQVLTRLSSWLENESDFFSRLRNALVYPIFVIIVMIIIVIIMLVKVVPQLQSIFESFNTTLPWTTRAIISFSNFFAGYWWLIAILAVGLIVFISYWLKTLHGREFFDKLKIKEPTELGVSVYMSRFANIISMLLRSGVPIVQSLEIASGTLNNIWYETALKKAVEDVERGIPLSRSIEGNSNFPSIVGQMMIVGEQTGKIDQILDSLSKYYESEVNNKLKSLVSLVEPILLVIIGIAVAFLVFAIIMPIYNLAGIF